jgi:hypothetical protein
MLLALVLTWLDLLLLPLGNDQLSSLAWPESFDGNRFGG